MSSFSSPSQLAIPLQFRRKSSSAATNVSIDIHAVPSSSPPSSSSPLLTPLHHLSRSCEWRVGGYDDLDGAIWDQRDKLDDVPRSWLSHARPEHSTSYMHRPLTSLITKFASHTPWVDPPPPYSPSPIPSTPKTTDFDPQGDSAISDDCEEYDLESMDIHIHETYFATSAERGRWLSSPIVSRARSQAARGYSSPAKPPPDTSPRGERLHKRPKSCAVDQQISASFLEDHDADMRRSSPLPPSSPITSPLSDLSFLTDDYEGDAIVDPCSNSDGCHSFSRTPERSTSSTACTSPVEFAHPPTQHGLAISSSLPLSNYPAHLHGSAISRHPSPHRSQSPNPIDAHSGFESDDILSPLSQFELDLPDGEPLKRPLSDMENKSYPGQLTAGPGVTVNNVWSHNGPQSVQSNLGHKSQIVSLHTVGGAVSGKNVKKRRGKAAINLGTKRTGKRVVLLSGNYSSDVEKRRSAENQKSNHSEPPSKKFKVSDCGDDSESYANFRPGGKHKVEQLRQSPSRSAIGHCDSGSACARVEQTINTVSAPVDVVDAEFHVSLTGMLIEAFATSRATSMDSAALYSVLTQAHPDLVSKRPKQELMADIAVVLEAGRVRCGMFEKVDSSGARSRHKALESRWFYIPERDEDEERASLISAIMPRQKRTETKKYKQYYYRPLDRISRWDPEDAA